ncbi:MAG: response regulator [Planctomycetes bacterium]|nr:response regulator [Planctomycetota bacterium]
MDTLCVPILVVDDEASIRDLVREALENDGHRVLEVADGRTALELALREPVALVVSDISMPGLSGLELLIGLRRAACRVPVILMTAYTGQHTEAKALRYGAYGFLAKPFDISSVVDMVRRALGSPCVP